MAFEIPQELQYKEKIIFGLTFEQLVYAIILVPIALLILLKLHISLYIRIFLALIPSTLAILLMFFNLVEKIRDLRHFFQFHQAELMDSKMKAFLGIQKIQDSTLFIRHKGSGEGKIAVLQAEPINFSIKNRLEQESIISSFQKLLNSLEFPIQVIIKTDNLNLDVYLKELEERVDRTAAKAKNRQYAELFRDYKDFFCKIIKDRNIINRSFYLAIREEPLIGLDIQASLCMDKLKAMNIKARRLNGNELTPFLSSYFNDIYEDETREPSEKIDEKNFLHFIIAPKFIKNVPDLMQVNSTLNRIIYAHGYPRSVEAGFLDKIITTNGFFDISIHIEPFPIEHMMVMLNKELQKQRADLYSANLRGMINPSLEIQYSDTRAVLENLQKGTEKLFNISFYINCKAKKREDLNLITKKLESELNGLMIIPKRPMLKMAQALKSMLPYSDNKLGMKRNITTKPLSAFFPFTSQFLQADESGIWLGLNRNDVPIIKDIFKLPNYNGTILASSGSGKSYFAKLLISRQILNGTKVMVIDPQSEYIELAKKFNGQVVNISRTSETMINPLDLMGHDYAEKRLSLMDLFQVMLGEISEIQKSVLDKALTAAYERKGINTNPKTWNNRPPILSDLLIELERMIKYATVIEKPTYRSLINKISMYVDGVFYFLNKHTKVNFNNNFVCFNIGDMPKQVKPAIMFLILDYIYMKMKKDKEKKLLLIDEAWSLLSRAEDASYIFDIVKTSRKFNLGLLLITQDVSDLLDSDAGNAVLANTSYTMLMRQKPAVMETVERTFSLSPAEKEKLLSADVGEGILIIDNDHTEIRIMASEEEHKLITTNPNEPSEKAEKEEPEAEERKEVDIRLDENKGYFRKSALSNEEVNFLLAKKYIISSNVPLGGGRQDYFLLRPSPRETPTHYFLIKAIEEYLLQFIGKIKLFETNKPDIVFQAGKKKVAIEVETGNAFDRDKKGLDEKIKLLNKGYGKDWFFVVTNAPDAYKYAKLGLTFTRKNVCRKLRSYFKNSAKNNSGLEA